MASLSNSTIASTYDRLLALPSGGLDGNNLVAITDGDSSTTIGMKVATNKIQIIPGSNDANAFEVALANGTALFTLNTSTPGGTLVSDEENILRLDGLQGNIDFRYGSDIEFDRAGQVYITANNGSGELNFRTGGQFIRMHIDSSGKVGIGTDAPVCGPLQINHAAADADNGILIVNEATTVADDTFLGGIGFDSADGNVPSSVGEASAAIVARSAEAHGTGDKGGNLLFLTSDIDDDDDTTSPERMRIASTGLVTIGTSGYGSAGTTSKQSGISASDSTYWDSTNAGTFTGLAISNAHADVGRGCGIQFSHGASSSGISYIVSRSERATSSGGDRASLHFGTRGSDGVDKRMTIGDDGNVNVLDGDLIIGTAGHGISFAADSHATNMSSELLDDYEEGTWTPSLSGASSHPTNSFNSRGGFYTKIGNRVFWSMRFSMSGSGITPGSGTLSVDGLPFTVRNDESMQGGIAIGHSANWLTGQHGAPTGGFYNTNSTQFSLVVYDNDGGNIAGMSYADAADVDESTTLTASGHFIL